MRQEKIEYYDNGIRCNLGRKVEITLRNGSKAKVVFLGYHREDGKSVMLTSIGDIPLDSILVTHLVRK